MPQPGARGPRGTVVTLESKLGLDLGKTFWDIANTYPNLMLTIAESVQNAIDADATRILIGMNLQDRTVSVADNGNGTDKEQFDLSLAHINRSRKDKRDKLGRFGRGVISPLNKCGHFEFISWPRGQKIVRKWTFVGSKIRNSESSPSIPCQEYTNTSSEGGLTLYPWLRAAETDDFAAKWRTVVAMHKVTADSVISLVDLDELESIIQTKYTVAMQDKKVLVRVYLVDVNGHVITKDIHPYRFTGEPLPEIICPPETQAGEVVFKLYRSPVRRGERTGKVYFGELAGGTMISIHEFARQARWGTWKGYIESALSALASGYFEGTILCENVELVPDRDKFENNDALKAFHFIVAEWYEAHGKKYFDDEQAEAQEQRYQTLGKQSQQRIRDVLMTEEYNDLWAGLRRVITYGRLGAGHIAPGRGKPAGTDASRTVRSGQGNPGGSSGQGSAGGVKKPGEKSPNAHDRPGDVPTGVLGPRGQRRQLIRGDSQGLWFEHSWMAGSSRLWEFDYESGTLTFNVRHPTWTKLDETNGRHLKKNDRWIMKLQELLALEILILLKDCHTPDELEEHRLLLDNKLPPMVELLIRSE